MHPQSMRQQMEALPKPIRLSIREQLLQQIKVGERAKEALEVLDNNPVIQEFLNKLEQ